MSTIIKDLTGYGHILTNGLYQLFVYFWIFNIFMGIKWSDFRNRHKSLVEWRI